MTEGHDCALARSRERAFVVDPKFVIKFACFRGYRTSQPEFETGRASSAHRSAKAKPPNQSRVLHRGRNCLRCRSEREPSRSRGWLNRFGGHERNSIAHEQRPLPQPRLYAGRGKRTLHRHLRNHGGTSEEQISTLHLAEICARV